VAQYLQALTKRCDWCSRWGVVQHGHSGCGVLVCTVGMAGAAQAVSVTGSGVHRHSGYNVGYS
jgi:hypothetical protein